MTGGMIARIQTGAEQCAALLFAGAVGYAAYGLAAVAGAQSPLDLCAAGAGALAYLPCIRLLGAQQGTGQFSLAQFELADFEFSEPPEELLLTDRIGTADELLLTERVNAMDELVLTDADRLDGDAPLDLDDILAEIGPDSRVVRLFDRKSMPRPTPGELQERISRLDGAAYPAPPDASQALSAALAELRRSLR